MISQSDKDALPNRADSYGPEALTVIDKAFAIAWDTIARSFNDPHQAEATRRDLAKAILDAAGDRLKDGGTRALDPAALSAAALTALRRQSKVSEPRNSKS